MAMFNSKLTVYQRVSINLFHTYHTFQPLKISSPFPQSVRDLLGSCVRMRSLCPVHQTLQPRYRETWTLPGLVNIQKAIENGHRNSGFSHE